MSNLLRVGYARRCITPKESVPLGGYGNSAARMSVRVLSDIYATCIAFSDETDKPVLLFHNDLLNIVSQIFDPIRQAIADAAGISLVHVLVAATHTHSGPDIRCEHEAIDRYLPYLKEQMVECALAALADRKSATIAVTSTKTKNMSYVRHYVLEDGSYKGVSLNIFSTSPVAYHSSEPDGTFQLVKFIREGGKDVVLANWQAHPHLTGFGKADLSADVVGVLRDELERELDCQFAYFSGASGNLNILSFEQHENFFPDYLDHGRELARYALEAAQHFTSVASGPVRLQTHTAVEPLRPVDENMLDAARDVRDFFAKNNIYRESMHYAVSKGFHSQYHATMMLRRYDMIKQGGNECMIPMYALRVGDVGFVTVPYEMFDTNGKYIRDFSPFAATIVATCANDNASYIPSAYGYLNDCYEGDVALVGPGAGERLAQKYVKMLEQLWEE